MSGLLQLAPADVRTLERHETEAHAIGGREIIELSDAIALIDPATEDPFWNRMTSVRWPADPLAFDRRLGEAITLFATRARRPHIWPSVIGDEPADLVDRLLASGFEDTGRGIVMARGVSADDRPPGLDAGVVIEVIRSADAAALARAARVLAEAFSGHGETDDAVDTRDTAEIEAAATAIGVDLTSVVMDPRVTFLLLSADGDPAAVAKVTGGSGLAYLSSIGTRPAHRGRGFAALVTRAALAEGARGGGSLAYLGVFEENLRAQRLYTRLGFAIVGRPVPDLLLAG